MAFKKKKEDFVCEHCGREVIGNGYTNHCPACLWSKHVDVDPGDRRALCGGLMKVVAIEREGREYMLTHECVVCGHQKRNRVSDKDDFDIVAKIAKDLTNLKK